MVKAVRFYPWQITGAQTSVYTSTLWQVFFNLTPTGTSLRGPGVHCREPSPLFHSHIHCSCYQRQQQHSFKALLCMQCFFSTLEINFLIICDKNTQLKVHSGDSSFSCSTFPVQTLQQIARCSSLLYVTPGCLLLVLRSWL